MCTEAKKKEHNFSLGGNINFVGHHHFSDTLFDWFTWTKLKLDHEFSTYSKICCPCIGTASNTNLTGPQKELLLWHWKLGSFMYPIQELMQPIEAINLLVFVMKCLLSSLLFSSLSLISRHLCFVNPLSWLTLSNVCLMSINKIQLNWTNKENCLEMPTKLAILNHWPIYINTPGRLLSWYGREVPHNQIHGVTLFHDAATGIIRAENQVSFGAGETLMSMERFEQLLWELVAAEIHHLHNDNGVFNAEFFVEDYKNKSQTQSFSGVDAHHQNVFV